MPDPNEIAKKVWEWLHSASWITWIGHALMMAALIAATVLFGGVGTGAVLLTYFGVREIQHYREGKPVFDCIMDFASPALVYLIYVRFLA